MSLISAFGCNDVNEPSLEERAYKLLSDHPYFYGHAVDFQFETVCNVLIVRGRLPTFYLKQVLQTLLKKLDGVDRVDNRVDVVWWTYRR
jgi:hypothetical protein